ncbi:MAG: type 4a pilus biogenesis protein PilO [Gemmatimonadetes bacterium]|nr:type 4a pilus biogenesis protein PilO [Gemmatimonadota bacterium]NNL29657.1 type 4a pilus biogenesis protein PilO [Gemmatimonadota bacterium]
MIIGIVMLLLIVPFYMYYQTPKNEDMAVIRDRLETLDIQNRQAAVILARGGQDLEERMALYQRHVSRLEELIPAQEEVPVLLDDIQRRARLVGVEVQGLDPEPTELAGPYNRTGYQMSVVGEYHAVARFLTEVASLSRIVTPVQVEVELFPNPLTFPDMESPVLATFRIETYVLPDQTAVAPAALPEG